jgi:hypothetical protein
MATVSISIAWSILRCLTRSDRCRAFSCFVLPAARAGGCFACARLALSAEDAGTACPCTVLHT